MIPKLIKIQQELKVPKNQMNKFGGYKYRSCEDIVEAVKPLLHAEGLLMTISDTMVNVGDKNYIKATVTVTDGDTEVTTNGYAREAVDRKGMDDSQITGSTSSYARKYALNGMFAIDDTKDADDLNRHGKDKSKPQSDTGFNRKKVENYIKKWAEKKDNVNELVDAFLFDGKVKKLSELDTANLKTLAERVQSELKGGE